MRIAAGFPLWVDTVRRFLHQVVSVKPRSLIGCVVMAGALLGAGRLGAQPSHAVPAQNTSTGRLGEMMTIPAGRFLMGNGGHEGLGLPEEFPQHSVDLPEFQIGKYEVTRSQYLLIQGK